MGVCPSNAGQQKKKIKKIMAPPTNKGSTALGFKGGLQARHHSGEVLYENVVRFFDTIRASDVGGQIRGWAVSELSKVAQR